jgi:hypothetical protein
MEHWPADERQKVLPVKHQGRGKKIIQVHDTNWNHPSLEFGTFGGATLVSSDGQLAWTTVVDTSGGERQPRTQTQFLLIVYNPPARKVTPVESGHCVFPATRPVNPTPGRLAQWRRIEEGV